MHRGVYSSPRSIMPERKQVRFYALLEERLNKSISKFCNEALTPALMRQIREEIKCQITSLFEASSRKLSPNAQTWLTDQYFKTIKVNDDQTMTDLVVINEYTLSELEFDDIRLLHTLFLETKMGPGLVEELKRRNSLLS